MRQPVNKSPGRSMVGLSLIELIVFIIIISLLATGMVVGFNRSLTGTATISQLGEAQRLAEERMELILPQRQQLGFAGFNAATFDPCTSAPASTQAVCTTWPPGFNVTANLQNNWLGDTNYQVITVSVSGPVNTQLQALAADY